MGRPIAIIHDIPMFASAQPDACWTPLPFLGRQPVPYTNISEISKSTVDKKYYSAVEGKELRVRGKYVLLGGFEIEDSKGDEAGVAGGGVSSENRQGPCRQIKETASKSVRYNGKPIVRFLDQTEQNMKDEKVKANAMGFVLSMEPSVLVGG